MAGLVGAALGAVGSIFGGISASRAMKKAKQNLQDQIDKNQDWYDRRYNEDATQRADAQRILTLTEDNIKRRNKAAEGTQAVMGGTEESVAATKAANAQALADATSTIAVNGEQRKDAIEGQYRQRDAALKQQLNQIEQGKAQAVTGAIEGLLGKTGDMDFGTIKTKSGKEIDL